MSMVSGQTPEYLIGRWRGFSVKEFAIGNFTPGEFGLLFTDSELTFLDETGKGIASFDVSGDKYNITLTSQDSKKEEIVVVVNELASTYLHSTVAYGFASNLGKSQAIPYSFANAMATDGLSCLVMLQCQPVISDKICNFNTVKPPGLPTPNDDPEPLEEQFEVMEPMNSAGPNFTHAVCNMKSGMCEECDPASSGMGCVATDKCQADCKKHDPKDYLYDCNWDGYKCGQIENGTLSKDECSDRCTKAAYGKCNFKT